MGLYDRQYYREEDEPGYVSRGSERPIVITLVLINVAVFAIDYFSEGQLTQWFALRADLFTHPWNAYQLLTAGFLHSTANIWHILINMYMLWMFGRDVETHYGRQEFLRLYLGLIVMSSLIWVVGENVASGLATNARMVGASGGVTGIVVIFACLFPRRTLLIWGVIPIRAWVLAGLFILLDLVGAASRETQTAYMAHLGGAACGFLYFRMRLNLGALSQNSKLGGWFKRQPKLKLRRPDDEEQDLSAPVDKVLEKISREGLESLTRKERKLLENASRRFQQRKQ